MDTNQTTAQPASAPSRGIFGTRIPSSVAFGFGVLLFFLPFVDIKCNNMSLQQVSGFQLATGFKMKEGNANNPTMGNNDRDNRDGEMTMSSTTTDKKDPNVYAIAALALGVVGLLLSFTNAKAAIGGAMATGVLSAGALIGLMMDIKKKAKVEMPKSETGGEFGQALDKMTDSMRITVDFTPWFWVAVIAFLAAAFFSYRRMQAAS